MAEIFRMTDDDVYEVSELDKRCFAIPWSPSAFADEMINDMAVYFVAKEDEKIVGYCGFWNVAGEGDITNIAVAPEYRRSGIGSALIEAMATSARRLGLSMLTLEVRKSNAPAQSLYKKYGFEEIGLRKRYYSDNREDALIMALKLKEEI